MGDEAAGGVSDVEAPQLVRPPLAERHRLDVDAARGHGAEEVRDVHEPNGDLAVRPDRSAGPDTRRALDGGRVDAAVNDAPWSVVLATDVDMAPHAPAAGLVHRKASSADEGARIVERAGFETWRGVAPLPIRHLTRPRAS